ncbi:hypothetical protein MKW94_014846 [Papaver nudicaule]|uniref:Cyclin N-terminal domain-containing protein n=1 Tax=Papaver nudicaule TaxID=74823 RepID=A0AA41RW93_PAPNU|nr:hypothetical protein [Papaver nudicaule]
MEPCYSKVGVKSVDSQHIVCCKNWGLLNSFHQTKLCFSARTLVLTWPLQLALLYTVLEKESSTKIIVDVDEYRADSSFSDPMFVKHTEAILDEVEIFEEIDLMEEEVEMEDIVEESVMDIDSCDSKNTLAVVEYIDDIYSHYKKTEHSSCVSPNYMVQQSDINEKMRAILVDWLIEVHYKFELMEETLFLMVNIIDRFLARQTVNFIGFY